MTMEGVTRDTEQSKTQNAFSNSYKMRDWLDEMVVKTQILKSKG